MIGMRDLTRHILYIAKKEGHKENQFFKGGLEKVVFMSFIYCLKYKINIRYDVLFHKTKLGATSDEVRRIFGDRYGRYISFEAARKINHIDYESELNKKLIDLVELESNKTFSLISDITNSEVFLNSEFYKTIDKKKEDDFFIAGRDNSVIWTFEEICKMAGVENNGGFRIPLKSEEYYAVKKYIKAKELWMHDTQSQQGFTFDEIMNLRYISDSILNSVEVNGAYLSN